MAEETKPTDLQKALAEVAQWIFVAPDALNEQVRAERTFDLTRGQQAELDQLVQTALRSGIAGRAVAENPSVTPYTDGNTALAVCKIDLKLEFVIKWQESDKLIREAAFLQSIAARSDLPQRVRDRVPAVYAVHKGDDRHAYLMQSFPSPRYETLARRLKQERGKPALCKRLISAAWDALFETYECTVSGADQPILPDIYSINLGRVKDRLLRKDNPDELIRLVQSPIHLEPQGQSREDLPSCENMLDEIQALWPKLVATLTPSFVTLVFGDPHPGNILIDMDYTGLRDVKFIDPKEWGQGDYLFDVAKFLHYLEVTWLVEDLEPPEVDLTNQPDGMHLVYNLDKPEWLGHGREDGFQRIEAFLSKKVRNDPNWRQRFDLSMASNLLGVAGSRYNKPGTSPNARRLIFVEGARALHRFLQSARSL